MKIDTTEVKGVWLLTKRWSLSYWPPKAWKPLSVREGQRGWTGRFGTVALSRRRDVQRTEKHLPSKEDPPFEVDKNRVLSTLWGPGHPMLRSQVQER